MFGFKKNRDDAQSGAITPGKINPAMAANAVQIICAGAGFSVINEGTRNWLSLPAVGLEQIGYAGLTVRIDTLVEEGEFSTDGVLDWYGVLNEAPEDEVLRAVNTFKEEYILPRVFVYTDDAGNRRLRAQVLWDWPDGYTVAQMCLFVEAVYSAATAFAAWVQEQWPDAPLVPPVVGPTGAGAALGGAEVDLASTEQMLAQFITPGNDFGLLSAPTPDVDLERVADNFASRTGKRSQVVNGNLLPICWEHQDIDIRVWNGYLTIDANARIHAMEPESEAIFLNRLNAWTTNRAGLTATLHHLNDEIWMVQYVSVRKIGAGMTEQQLTDHLRGTCKMLAENFEDIMS